MFTVCKFQASENPETPFVGATVSGSLGLAMWLRYYILLVWN